MGDAHEVVSQRPPISLSTVVARAHMYTNAVNVWELSIVQGTFSVAPRQTLESRFATFPSLYTPSFTSPPALAGERKSAIGSLHRLSLSGCPAPKVMYAMPRCALGRCGLSPRGMRSDMMDPNSAKSAFTAASVASHAMLFTNTSRARASPASAWWGGRCRHTRY